MKIPEAVKRDYDRWDLFLEQQVDFSLKDNEKHTKAHCARVLLYALLIAEKMDLSPELRDGKKVMPSDRLFPADENQILSTPKLTPSERAVLIRGWSTGTLFWRPAMSAREL